MVTRLGYACLICSLFIVGCNDSNLTGRWEGEGNFPAGRVGVRFDIEHTFDTVFGQAYLFAGGNADTLDLSGIVRGDSVFIVFSDELESEDLARLDYLGAFSRSRITGSIRIVVDVIRVPGELLKPVNEYLPLSLDRQ